MFLVVFTHTLPHFTGPLEKSFIYPIVNPLRMPMFFMISGFVNYSIVTADSIKSVLIKLKKKAIALLIPFFVVGLSYVLTSHIFHNWDIPVNLLKVWLTPATMWGYWFLPVLFAITIITSFIGLVLKSISGYSSFVSKNTDLFFVITFILTPFVLKVIAHYTFLHDIGCVFFLTNFIHFYFFGIFIKRFSKMESFLSSTLVNTVAFIIMIVLFFYTQIMNLDISNQNIIFQTFFSYVCVIFFYGMFKRLDTQSRIGRLFQSLGNNTLEIYIFHFFFLLGLEYINIQTQEEVIFNSFIISFTTIVIVSSINILFCMNIGNFLKKNPYLNFIILGRIPKRVIEGKNIVDKSIRISHYKTKITLIDR